MRRRGKHHKKPSVKRRLVRWVETVVNKALDAMVVVVSAIDSLWMEVA